MKRGTLWPTNMLLAILCCGVIHAEAADYYKRNADGTLIAGVTPESHELHLRKGTSSPHDLTSKMPSNKRAWSLQFNTHLKVEGASYWNGPFIITVTGTDSSGTARTIATEFYLNQVGIVAPPAILSRGYSLAASQSPTPQWTLMHPSHGSKIMFNHSDHDSNPANNTLRSIDNTFTKKDYWFSVDDGIFAFGHGTTPGEDIRWAWRFFASGSFTTTKVTIASKYIDMLIGAPSNNRSAAGPRMVANGAGINTALESKITELVGGSATDIASAYAKRSNSDRRTIAAVRTAANKPNPTDFVRTDVQTLSYSQPLVLTDQLPTSKNRWSFTFGLQGNGPSSPLRFSFKTIDGKSTYVDLDLRSARVYTDVAADSGLPDKGIFHYIAYDSTTREGKPLWIGDASGQYKGMNHLSVDTRIKKNYCFMFASQTYDKDLSGMGYVEPADRDMSLIMPRWFAFDNGILATGTGTTPGQNVIWAWPLFDTENAHISELAVTQSSSTGYDFFDLTARPHSGLPALKQKIEAMVGPENASAVIEKTAAFDSSSRNVMAKARTWLGWENPAEGWLNKETPLPHGEKVSFIEKLGDISPEKWVATFRLINPRRAPLHINFVDENDQVTTLKLIDRHIALDGPIHKDAGFYTYGHHFDQQKHLDASGYVNRWGNAHYSNTGGTSDSYSTDVITVNFSRFAAPRNAIFEETTEERPYWFGRYENYIAFGYGETPSKESIAFAWMIAPEGKRFALKDITVEMPLQDYFFSRWYDSRNSKYVTDYSRLSSSYQDLVQAVFGLRFTAAQPAHKELYHEKLESWVMDRDPKVFASATGQQAGHRVNLTKIRAALGWDKDDTIKPGTLSVHNKQENNPLRTDTLPTPGACHLRFDMYDSEKTTVLLKDSEGEIIHDIRIGWGNGIALEGTDNANADYTKPEGTNKEKFWVDYHGSTLTIGTLDENDTPTVQLTATDETPQSIASFSIVESSTKNRTQLVMEQATTFAPVAFMDAMKKSLTAGEALLPSDLILATPAEHADSWVMLFDADTKAQCSIGVAANETPLHTLTLGRWNFLEAVMSSALPAGYNGPRFNTIINNGRSSADESWRADNGVPLGQWSVTQTSDTSKVEAVIQGYGPTTKYLAEPTAEGELNTHWVMYHDNMMAFGHGNIPGRKLGYIWQPTVQYATMPTQLHVKMDEGSLKNIRFQKINETLPKSLLENYKALVFTDKGDTAAVQEILDKRSAKTIFAVDKESKLANGHFIALNETARTNQRVACTFKTSATSIIPGFSGTMQPGKIDYWVDINTSAIPGKMVAHYRDKDGNDIPHVMSNYDYNGETGSWENKNPDGAEGTHDTIHIKSIDETATTFANAALQQDQTMWLVFDKGWLAYGRGSIIGENIGMVWHFVDNENRRPINYLSLDNWIESATFYDLAFIEHDDAQWRTTRNALEIQFIKQLPEKDKVAAALRSDVVKNRADTLTIPAGSTERKEIPLPTDSTQAWVATFDVFYKKDADGTISNRDIRFFLETHTSADDSLKSSAYIVRLNTGFTEFISDPGKRLGNGDERGNVVNQFYRLNRGSTGKPFNVWTTSGRENNHYLAHLWVNGGDNGRFGTNNNSGRIHPYQEDADGNNVTISRRWLAYHEGYLAIGIGNGPAPDGSNVGLIWKMQPHMNGETDGPRALQKVTVGSADGNKVMLTNVATRPTREQDTLALVSSLDAMISGTRKDRSGQERIRGELDKPGLDLVNHMRKEVGLPPQDLKVNDAKILVAEPVRSHHSVAIPADLASTQKFVVSFTAQTQSRLLMNMISNKKESLCSLLISAWLDQEKATAGVYAMMMKQRNGFQYIKDTVEGGFNTVDNDVNKGYSRISVKNQPLTVAEQPNPMLTVAGSSAQYWVYYDGGHLAFGHGASPSEGTVGFTWKLIEPLSDAVSAFQFGADVNLLLTPPINVAAPSEADTQAVLAKIINADLAMYEIGNSVVKAPGVTPAPVEEVTEEVEKEATSTNEATPETTTEATTTTVETESTKETTSTEETKSTEGTVTETTPEPAPEPEEKTETAPQPAPKPTAPAPTPAAPAGSAVDAQGWTLLDDTADNFLLTFNAKATDNFKIAFASSGVETPAYALELGANKVVGSRIFKAGSTDAHVTFAEVGIASNAVPINYWLTHNKGHFVLGQGVTPGGGILIDWRDNTPASFTRCKLMGNSETAFSAPIVKEVTTALAAQLDGQYIAIGNNGIFNQWRSDWQLNAQGIGNILFNARSTGALHIGLATTLPTEKSSQEPRYKLTVDRGSGRISSLSKDGAMLGAALSTSAILPKDTLSHPYWLTYDIDKKLIAFGKGTTPGENELLRRELDDPDKEIRYFSFTNSDAGVLYNNISSTSIVKSGADFGRANPGNGLAATSGAAVAETWKPEWQFSDAANTARFDIKGENGAVIVLGPSASEPNNTYRIRLSTDFPADIIEGDNDRRVKVVAKNKEASLLPNDGQFHSFWIRRLSIEDKPTTITLGTWSKDAIKEDGKIGDVTLIDWHDITEPVAVNAFTFAAYDAAATIENITLFNTTPADTEVPEVISSTPTTTTSTVDAPAEETTTTAPEETAESEEAPAAVTPAAPQRATRTQRLFRRYRPRNQSTRDALEARR